jgi:Na+/proline symporter
MLSCALNRRARHTLWVALGILCCALIACAAIVQVSHTHPDGQTVQSDCALCLIAHVVVQPAISIALLAAVLIVAMICCALQSIRICDFSVFALFTRPPPVDTALA